MIQDWRIPSSEFVCLNLDLRVSSEFRRDSVRDWVISGGSRGDFSTPQSSMTFTTAWMTSSLTGETWSLNASRSSSQTWSRTFSISLTLAFSCWKTNWTNCQLRARRALMPFKDVLLRTRWAQARHNVYDDSALLVLNRIWLNSVNALLALKQQNWRYLYVFDMGIILKVRANTHNFWLGVCKCMVTAR